MIETIFWLSVSIAIVGLMIFLISAKEDKPNMLIVFMGILVVILGICIIYSIPTGITGKIDIVTQLDDNQPYYAYETITPNNQSDSKIILAQKINPITGELFGDVYMCYISKEKLPLPYHCIYAPTKIISKNGKIEIWNSPFQQ